MKPNYIQKNYKGSHLLEPMASPGAQAPISNFIQTRTSKHQLVDLTNDNDNETSTATRTSAQKHPFPLHKHSLKKQKQQLHMQKKIQWKAEEIHHYNPLSPALPTNLIPQAQTNMAFQEIHSLKSPPLFPPAPPPPPLIVPSMSIHSNPFINTQHTTQNTGLQNLTNPFHSPTNTITRHHHMKQKAQYHSHKKQAMKKHMPNHHHNKRS
jgi:hypothetical protein